MNGQEVIDEAVDILEATDAIDHWQPDRERIEAEELLSHLIGTDWKAADEIPPKAIRRSASWSRGGPPGSRFRTSRATRSSAGCG